MQNVTLQFILEKGAIILGIFFVYIALFTYEDEHKKVQNKLLGIWNNISSDQKRPSLIKPFLLRTIAGLKKNFENHFFMRTSFLKSIVACLIFCSSLAMIAMCIRYFLDKDYETRHIFSVFLGLLYFIIFLLLFRFVGKYRLILPLYCILVTGSFFVFYIIISKRGIVGVPDTPQFFLPGFLIGLGASILILLSSLWIILFSLILIERFVHSGWHWLIILALAFVAPTIVYLITIKGYELLFRFADSSLLNFPGITEIYGEVFACSFAGVFLLNIVLFTYLILFGILVVSNRLLWPLLKFPIRALYEHKVIANRKLLGAIGVALLAYGIPGIKEMPIVHNVLSLLKMN